MSKFDVKSHENSQQKLGLEFFVGLQNFLWDLKVSSWFPVQILLIKKKSSNLDLSPPACAWMDVKYTNAKLRSSHPQCQNPSRLVCQIHNANPACLFFSWLCLLDPTFFRSCTYRLCTRRLGSQAPGLCIQGISAAQWHLPTPLTFPRARTLQPGMTEGNLVTARPSESIQQTKFNASTRVDFNILGGPVAC